MTHTDGTITDLPTPPSDGRPSAKPSLAPLWLGIGAIVAPIFFFAFFPFVGLLAVGGVIAVVLALRARRRGQSGAALSWAIGLGAVGALVDAVLVVIALVALFGPGLVVVELQAEGGQSYTVRYADDSTTYEEEWTASGWAKYTTAESSAEITVVPPTDGDGPQQHSCRILWDGVVVSEESSDSGPVTCSYVE